MRNPWVGVLIALAVTITSGAAVGQPHNEIEASEPVGGFPPRTGPSRMIDRIIALPDQPNIRVFQFRPAKPSDISIFYIHGDYDSKSDDDPHVYPKNVLYGLELGADSHNVNIYAIARPGLFGSGGDYGTRERRSRKTYQMVNTVIDALISWDQMKRIGIVGHSGGAAYVLTHPLFRKHEPPKCYVLASGSHHLYLRIAAMRREREQAIAGQRKPLDIVTANPEKNYLTTLTKLNVFEPSLHLWSIAPESGHHFIIVGDVRDEVVPFESSEKLALDLSAHELNAELEPVALKDKRHHGSSFHAIRRAAECARSLKDQPSATRD
jgi:hypothetical protein